MRASRLMTLVNLLQARGQMSTTELAAALEVSPRTVLRDLDALSSAGIPVFAARGGTAGSRCWTGSPASYPRSGGRRAAPRPAWRQALQMAPRVARRGR